MATKEELLNSLRTASAGSQQQNQSQPQSKDALLSQLSAASNNAQPQSQPQPQTVQLPEKSAMQQAAEPKKRELGDLYVSHNVNEAGQPHPVIVEPITGQAWGVNASASESDLAKVKAFIQNGGSMQDVNSSYAELYPEGIISDATPKLLTSPVNKKGFMSGFTDMFTGFHHCSFV